MSARSTTGVATLLKDYSLEITGADAGTLRESAALVPSGSRVNVTYLAGEDLSTRVAAARAVKELGFEPVPHLAARRLRSLDEAREYLSALSEVGATDHLFIVGGDPSRPEGPFESAAELIDSGILQEFGVKDVGIGGYPEGHPEITEDALWTALLRKTSSLAEQGVEAQIITQFGFDDDPVVAWIRRVREARIAAPIRIGLPGPAGIKRLLSFARRFGVSSSAGIAKKYGFSLTNLLGTAGPDRLASALAGRLDPAADGPVGVHLYTFGSVPAAAAWAAQTATS